MNSDCENTSREENIQRRVLYFPPLDSRISVYTFLFSHFSKCVRGILYNKISYIVLEHNVNEISVHSRTSPNNYNVPTTIIYFTFENVKSKYFFPAHLMVKCNFILDSKISSFAGEFGTLVLNKFLLYPRGFSVDPLAFLLIHSLNRYCPHLESYWFP